MKKVIGMVLVAVFGLSLAACGGSETSDDMVLANGEYVSEADAAAFEESDSESTDEASEEELDTSAMIEETVLWEEDDFKVTAISLSYTEWYVLLKLRMENNSDQTLTFYNGTAGYDWSAVNDYMVDSSYISEEVEPGESVEASFENIITSLELLGIEEVADMRFGMAVKYEDGDVIELPEAKVTTSAYDSYDYNTDTYWDVVDAGLFVGDINFKVTASAFDTLYSENGISLISEVLAYPQTKTENNGNPVMYFEMDNQSEDNVYIQISDIMINDVMIAEDTWSAYPMFSESKLVQQINFDTVFRLNGVDEELLDEIDLDSGIDSVAFDLSVEDENGTEIAAPETITIDFK